MVSYVVTRTGSNVTTSVFSGGSKLSESSESLESYRSRGSNRTNRAIAAGNVLVEEYNKGGGSSSVVGYDVTTDKGTTRYQTAPATRYQDTLEANATDVSTGRPVAYSSPSTVRGFVPLPLTEREKTPSRPAAVLRGGGPSPGLQIKPESELRQTARYAGGVLASGGASVANWGPISNIRSDPGGAASFVLASNPVLVGRAGKVVKGAYEISPLGQGVSSGLGVYGRGLEAIGTRSAATAWTVNLAVSTGATYGAVKGIQAVGTQATRFKGGDTYSLVASGQGRAAYAAGMAEADAYSASNLRGRGYFLERGARQIPILDLAATDRPAFERGVSNYAASSGLSGSSALSAARSYGTTRRLGFAGGLISANTFSEIGGQAAFASSFSRGVAPVATKGGGKALFIQGFKNIAPQGVIEGTSADIAFQASEGRTFKTFKYGELGIAGLAGGASAGVLGGTIYSTSVTRPKISRGISGFANVVDPYEGAGDYVAGTARGVSSPGVVRGAGAFSFVPSTTSTPTTTQTTLTGTTSARSQLMTPTTIQSRTAISSRTQLNPYSFITTSTRTPVSVRTSIQSVSKTDTRSFINTPVTTSVQTNTRTPTTTTTSIFTPGFGFPLFGGGGGGGGFGGRLGGGQFKTYTPSLAGSVLNVRGRSRDKGLTGLTIRGI